MKPVNLNTAPCAPISSNCVIWQGPNIPCINLCNGDTVSDVVFALATELCGILETLNVANYDLTCFGITSCGPNDFQALIQFLISQICELQGITPSITKESTGCPDCLVTVAPCFVTNGQTTMNLVDYVNMIAQRICNIIDELALINAALTSLDIRVTILENAPVPTFSLPTVTTSCQIGALAPGVYQMDLLLNEFFPNVWCPLSGALGSTANILAAISNECIFGTDNALSSPPGSPTPMQVLYPSWNAITPAGTLASTINHLWVSLCDMYSYLSANPITTTVVAAGTNVTVTSATVGATTTYTVNAAEPYDSGWKNIPYYTMGTGYGLAPTTVTDVRPQIRIVDRVVTINGLYPLPLATNAAGTILVTNLNDWKDTFSPYLYKGIDGGYEKLTTTERMESLSPILPVALRPDTLQYLNPVAHILYRSIERSSIPQIPPLSPVPGIKKLTLQAFCPYFYIRPSGKFGFGTAQERQGFGVASSGFDGQLAESCSIFTSGDIYPDYTSYESGYTSAGVNQRLSPASFYSVPFDIDTRDGDHFGGFYTYFNARFHISPSTSMQDIIDAFDNL